MKRLLWAPILGAAAWCAAWPAHAQDEARPRGDQQALFDRIDNNKDGVLTEDEIPEERKRLFERLVRNGDKNGDGKISRDEFAAASQDPSRRREGAPEGERPRPEQRDGADVSALFRGLDKNRDGKVSPDEIPEERRERFRNNLPRADKDGDGSLNLEEFRAAMAAMAGQRPDAPPPQPAGPPPGRPNLAGAPFFRAIDANADGKLSSDELAKAGEALKKLDRNGDGSLTPEELLPPGPPPGAPQPPRPGEAGRPDQAGRELPEQAKAFLERLKRADANGDGKLSKDETPERMKENFERIDTNSDGFLDQAELQRMVQRFGSQQPEGNRPEGDRPRRPGNRQPNPDI